MTSTSAKNTMPPEMAALPVTFRAIGDDQESWDFTYAWRTSWFSFIGLVFSGVVLLLPLIYNLKSFIGPMMIIGPVYGVLALRQLLNKTTFSVRRGALEIHTGPMAIRRHQLFTTEEIRQFYVKEHRGKHISYSLQMVVKGRRKHLTVIPMGADKKGLLAVERAIEAKLGIKDIHVHGQAFGPPAWGPRK